MKRMIFALAIALLIPLFAAPAHAQATRTWVSGVGDDANPCSRTAPCKTFAGAISKTATGGEINCIDPGGFGAVTIVKSISIFCDGVTGGVIVSSTNGVIINITAAGDPGVVRLKGLDIEGLSASTSPAGLSGIRVLSAGTVVVEECSIRNFGESGIAILSSSNLNFTVSRSTITRNGSGASGAGIRIFPSAGGVTGLVDRVVLSRNVYGIAADGSGGGAGINITVADSSVNGSSQTGILATTGATGAGIMVSRTAVVNNNVGLLSVGSGAILRAGSSVISGNGTGVSGVVLSYGNNQLNGNGADGTFAPVPGGLL